MTTTTSFTDRRRFRSLVGENLRRHLGTMVYTFVLTFFFFPVQYLLEIFRALPGQYLPQAADSSGPMSIFRLLGPAQIHTSLSIGVMTAVLLVAPLAAAVGQMQYLFNRRSVDLYHSLPVSRGTLMLSGGLCAFLITAIPMAINYGIVLAAGLIRRLTLPAHLAFAYLPGEILLDALGWSITSVVIISVVLLVASQVGTSLENLSFSSVLMAAPFLVLSIGIGFSTMFLLGFVSPLTMTHLSRLTPLALMIQRYSLGNRTMPLGSSSAEAQGLSELMMSNLMMAVWLAVGLAALWLALRLYARRKSEMAESSAMTGPIGLIAKAIITFMGASGIGMLFTGLLTGSKEANLPLVFWNTLGAALTFLLMEAVINRGFRGIKKSLPAGAAFTAGILCLSLILVTGGLGYENRIPKLDRIQQVTIDTRGRFAYIRVLDASTRSADQYYESYDQAYGEKEGLIRQGYRYNSPDSVTLRSPQAVELVRQIHAATIRQQRGEGNNTLQVLAYADRLMSFGSFKYDLGGSSLQRSYGRRWYQDMNPELESLLWQLEANPEFIQKTCPLFFIDPTQYRGIQAADRLGLEASAPLRDPGQLAQVVEALKADLLNQTPQQLSQNTARTLGYLHFSTALGPVRYGTIPQKLEQDAVGDFSIRIHETFTHTLAVLKQLGLETPLYADTRSQVDRVVVQDYLSDDSLGYYAPGTRENLPAGDSHNTVTDPDRVAQLLSLAREMPAISDRGNGYFYLTPFTQEGLPGVQLVLHLQDAPGYLLEMYPHLVNYAKEYTTPAAATMEVT